MYPILFEIPGLGFPVRSFGVMVVLGFLAGSTLLTRLGLRASDDPQRDRRGLDAVPLWGLMGVMAGARLMYVGVEVLQGTPNGQAFLERPILVLAIWKGGLVMYGGAFGALLAAWWAAHKHGLRVLHVLDLGVVGAFLGLSIGRIGCILVGDDYGSLVPERWQHLPFPITLTVPEELAPGSLFGASRVGQMLWCTQMWMSANALMLSGVGYFLLRRRRYYGQVSLWLMLLYGVTRFCIEIFRGDAERGLWLGDTVSTSQLISILVALVCVVFLVRFRARTDPGARLPARGESIAPTTDTNDGAQSE
ncbi:MAG: prolipoprotein diacylglyceryl transferase family protein [Planctomycetota bacterium]